MHDRTTAIDTLIKMGLEEDLDKAGDLTSLALFSADTRATACICAKEKGVISGTSLITPIFHTLSDECQISLHTDDGDVLCLGDKIATISGPIIAILSGERLVLNLLQHLSGIATATKNLVEKISHTQARLLDTRKTTVNLRFLEKEAVLHGGGTNHRFGLFDMVMIKDTHVKAAKGPDLAVIQARKWLNDSQNSQIKIEVEVQTVEEFKKALAVCPNRIMLDNMSLDEMTQAVTLRNSAQSSAELEASGNITADTITAVAETGVDFISVGAITHSVQALDIHLRLQ